MIEDNFTSPKASDRYANLFFNTEVLNVYS